MKKVLVIGLATLCIGAVTSYGQGTITFANFSSNKLSRADTQGLVANSPAGGWKVALYWLPDQAGTPEDSAFRVLEGANAATIGVPVPGQFSGGQYTIPGGATGIPLGGIVWAQVRAWQAIYNGQTYPTYESIFSAPVSGALPLAGKSNPFKIDTGDPSTVPPGTPGNLSGMLPFTLVPVPEPSVIGLGLLGLGTLLVLRRRK
jgi:MYXO-CTERM domain-containing protein